MRLSRLTWLAVCFVPAVGCHSPYIEATITNRSAQPIELIELDYPTASFGTQNLLPGGTFRYRFKVLGTGTTKLIYTDAGHREHTSSGPNLQEGQEGRLTIELTGTTPEWHFAPTSPSH